MGIFSANFQREGPGVKKDEPSKKGISLFFKLFAMHFRDLIKLNIIFILYCIPVVTIFPAIAAMTSVTMDMIRTKHIIYIIHDFHKAFKENWKQSFICGLIISLILILLSVSLEFYFNAAKANIIFYLFFFLCITISIIFGLACLYIYPLITSVSIPLKDILKNALLLSLTCLKHTLCAALAYIIIAGFTIFFFPLILPLYLFLSFSVLSFISSFATWFGINKYIVIN